ncbi:hypothetical protein ACN38_g7144 [Penicillium nordicum]|uniref:Uncharacterized protein n=1 Tax=Penicillium nordicum TaxID=229535 RepID=A0A0M8P5Z5_9EURO|nr:hypothetical protein ACN38_g7144 [Penicillium nordicum]
MTRCVKGSEFSHLELSMLWAGKLIDHCHKGFHYSVPRLIIYYILWYVCGVQYFIIPRLEDCGNWRYGDTTRSSPP